MRFSLFLITIIALAGCAVLWADPINNQSLASQTIIDNTQTPHVHHYAVAITKDKETHNFILRLEKTPIQISAVGIGPLGEPLFSCMITRDVPKPACDTIDPKLQAERFTNDVLAVISPSGDLKTSLHASYHLEQNENKRSIFYNEKPIITILYKAENSFQGATFKHHIYKYIIDMSLLSVEDLK